MDTTFNILDFLLALGAAGAIIYIRQNLLKEYFYFTAKGYLQSQKNNNQIIHKKTDVTLFFTKQNKVNK